jgi:Fur family peroxide stress response transcriptional regulator
MKTATRGESGGTPLETLDRVLRARGERATRQRRAIFAALAERADHPTAEALHRQVRPRVPGMSLATIYTALEVLVDAGLACRLAGPDGVAHYDARTDTHDHQRCLGCGRIEDLERPPGRTIRTENYHAPGFRAVDCRLEVVGYCADCDRSPGALIETRGTGHPRSRKSQED